MNNINIYRYWILLGIVCLVGFAGCKNQQKAAEEQAAAVRAENIAKAKEILLSILNDDGQMSIAEKERKLRQAKALNADDPEVLRLIAQVEKLIQQEKDAQSAPVETVEVDPSLEENLDNLFADIARASTASSANSLIERGLDMFGSPDTPVLIIISMSGNLKDYDQPTTIGRYLNYLKDHKISPNRIYQVKQDDAGKINELELIKKSIR